MTLKKESLEVLFHFILEFIHWKHPWDKCLQLERRIQIKVKNNQINKKKLEPNYMLKSAPRIHTMQIVTLILESIMRCSRMLAEQKHIGTQLNFTPQRFSFSYSILSLMLHIFNNFGLLVEKIKQLCFKIIR